MSASFEIIGTLKACKETEAFKPFEVRDFDSGWQTTRYRFNAISGSNRFMLEVGGGKWKEDSKNKILTLAKAKSGEKAQKFEVKWEDRKNSDVIDKVAGFKIYTCNLLDFAEQKELKETGNEEEINKKNHRFLEPTEFATFVKKVIDSGKYADALFKIQGTVDFQYSAKNDQFYRTLTVNKIYKVTPDTACKSEATINTFYTEEAIDDTNFDEAKKYVFNCFTDYYFGNVKANRFVPMSLVIRGGDEKADKIAAAFKKKLSTFSDEATVRKCGLVIDMIDGAEEQTVKLEDLDEETQENVMLGLISEADAIAAVGGKMMGDRITEYRVKSLSRTSSKGSEATVYTEEDLQRKPIVEQTETTEDENDDVDLFSDEDDDI